MKTEIQLQPLRDIEAQLRTMESEQIAKYAQAMFGGQTYLEIGTKFGGSAYWVRANADPACEVYSIDPKPMLFMFKGQEKNVGINWITARSLDAKWDEKKPIHLLFIDGDHGEGTITAPWDDFDKWEKFVPSGGVIMMHDYHYDFPEVLKACDRILETGRYELLEKPPAIANRQDTSLFIVKKK